MSPPAAVRQQHEPAARGGGGAEIGQQLDGHQPVVPVLLDLPHRHAGGQPAVPQDVFHRYREALVGKIEGEAHPVRDTLTSKGLLLHRSGVVVHVVGHQLVVQKGQVQLGTHVDFIQAVGDWVVFRVRRIAVPAGLPGGVFHIERAGVPPDVQLKLPVFRRRLEGRLPARIREGGVRGRLGFLRLPAGGAEQAAGQQDGAEFGYLHGTHPPFIITGSGTRSRGQYPVRRTPAVPPDCRPAPR